MDDINTLLLASSAIFKRLGSGERLTRTETDRLHTMKQRYEQRASDLAVQLETSVNQAASHFLSFYDAFRLYGDGISQVGYGGNSFSAKLHTSGIDWVGFLPAAMGEPALRSALKKEKYERARQRKNAAVSAIEREKLRRELDEEERNSRRKNEIANAQKIRDEEEKVMFGEVYSGLVGSREEKMSTTELNEFIRQWEKLMNMRERRYPDSLKLAVIYNDVGCVKIELCPDSDLRLAQAVVCIRDAAMIALEEFKTRTKFSGEVVTSMNEAYTRIRDMLPAQEQLDYDLDMEEYEELKAEKLTKLEVMPEPPTFCFDSLRDLVAPHYPAAFFLLFLNYFTVLRTTSGAKELQEGKQQCMKEMLFFIYTAMLNAKDRKNLGLERKLELFTVFPLGDVEEGLKLTLDELAQHRADLKKEIEDQELQERLQMYKGRPAPQTLRKNVMSGVNHDQVLAMEALALADPAEAKKMKFRRDMRAAKRKRKISIKQRNKMYSMISNDQISEFFHQQARKADINVVKWGDEEEEAEIDDPFYVSEDSSDDDSSTQYLNGGAGSSSNPPASANKKRSSSCATPETGSAARFEGGMEDAASLVSDTSSLTTAGASSKKKSIMSFLMKGRKAK